MFRAHECPHFLDLSFRLMEKDILITSFPCQEIESYLSELSKASQANPDNYEIMLKDVVDNTQLHVLSQVYSKGLVKIPTTSDTAYIWLDTDFMFHTFLTVTKPEFERRNQQYAPLTILRDFFAAHMGNNTI
jgi:hypothetical protein